MPFALVIDRMIADDDTEHKYSVSYQMDVQPYSVDGKTFTADFGDGVTMSVIGASEPEVIVAQKKPYFIGWRKRGGADSDDFEHFHAPCLQFVANGKEKRVVTVLYPSDNGETVISDVFASDDINATEITLTVNCKKTVIDEKDYECSESSAEKLSL